jgi:hypothetical protein
MHNKFLGKKYTSETRIGGKLLLFISELSVLFYISFHEHVLSFKIKIRPNGLMEWLKW